MPPHPKEEQAAADEPLREALIALEHSRAHERTQRLQAEALLEGLRALTSSESTVEMFEQVVSVLHNFLQFDDAFISTTDVASGSLQTIITSSETYARVTWQPAKAFRRILSGKTLTFFDTSAVEEWTSQASPDLLTHARSSLHLPIRTGTLPAIVTCVSNRVGAFSQSDVRALARFGPLLSQTLLSIESRESLELLVEQRTRDLQAAKEAAEESSRSQSRFLAVMSHELRTPLNAVVGGAELARNSDSDARRNELLDTIVDSGQLLTAIIGDILDFSRAGSEQIEFELSAMNVQEHAQRTLNSFGPLGTKRGLDLSLCVEPNVPTTVISDGLRLRQVLGNLIQNAIKFTDHGSVSVRVRNAGGTDGQARLRYEVSDTGIGIATETVDLLFDAFRQADSTVTRRFGGTGLGLAICRRLVTALGGSIGAEGQPSVGSTFWFELPCDTTEAPDPEPESAKLLNSSKALDVLVAEDNVVNARIIRGILEHLGHKVLLVENGEQAIVQSAAHKFDVLLLDMMMPVMDGITAAQHIREILSSEDLYILALTANASAEARTACLDAGMNGFLTKPVTVQSIRDALDQQLSS